MSLLFTSSDSVKSTVRSIARHCALVAGLSGVALLSAPFLKSTQHDQRLPDRLLNSKRAESRIGVTLRHGDTLTSVVKRFGIQPPSARALIEKVRPFVNPKTFRPGGNVQIILNPEDRTVESMEFVTDDKLVRVKATVQGWSVEHQDIPFVRESRLVRGTIKRSLYESGTEAGLKPQHVLDLAKLFEYDVDFFADFRSQDRFSVLFEDLRYADGRTTAGRILAAELESEEDIFDAFYFVGKDGNGDYYNSKGEALRRLFLRAPLSYVRISSPFNRSRMDPIFRSVRPHMAIDYAAPSGSPVVSIGNGRVEFVGWRNGFGNVVDIRHSGNYLSRYAHFSRFAEGVRQGQAVSAGEVIGYVGQTGHTTGPHLHFEFLQGETKINFLDLRIPKDQVLSGEDLLRFAQLRDQQQAMLRRENERVAERWKPVF